MKEMSKQQEEIMKKHSIHHTKEHMSIMRSEMRKGKTFSQSHKTAKSKAGK